MSRGPASRWNVFAAVRSHGRFGPARRLGVSRAYPYGGSGAGAEGDSPKVAVDRSGNAIFLWRRDDSSLQAVRMTARGRFEPVRTIIARSGKDPTGASDISLGFDGRGTAYAAWASAGVRVAAWPRGASRFGVPRIVSTQGQPASQPRMAVGASGTIAVAWRHSPADDPAEASPGPIEAAIGHRGAGFSPPQSLDPACNGTHPDVAVAGAGEAIVIWLETCGAERPLVGAGAPPGGSFGPVEPIYSGPPDLSGAIYATVAAGGSGQALAAFSPGFSASVRSPGGPFGSPRRIADSPGYATTPRLAAGRRLAVAAWQGKGGFFYSTLRF